MCRSTKKIQHIGRKSSSAEEDNLDYNKIQKINGNIKKVFYNTILLVNERPIEFITDSGSPVTLIPHCSFNKTTEVEPLISTYRDVNNHQNRIYRKNRSIGENKQQDDKATTTYNKRDNITVDGIRLEERLGIHINTINNDLQTIF